MAQHLQEVELPGVGGDMSGLREHHLSEAVRAVLGKHLKTSVVSTVIKLPEWPSLGRSATDFVCDWPPGTRRFRHVGELK